MNDAQTIEHLYDLRLGAMAEAFSEEVRRSGDPALSFAERFGLIVERQWRAREEGRLSRRLKAAQLKIEASVEETDLRTPRGLDRSAFLELAELGFLRSAGNVILTGATGLGKTRPSLPIGLIRPVRMRHSADAEEKRNEGEVPKT